MHLLLVFQCSHVMRVAGLVEVPCVKRNVIGAINAVAAADMVLAGIDSVIPPDDVIDAMGEIGHEMSYKIKDLLYIMLQIQQA